MVVLKPSTVRKPKVSLQRNHRLLLNRSALAKLGLEVGVRYSIEVLDGVDGSVLFFSRDPYGYTLSSKPYGAGVFTMYSAMRHLGVADDCRPLELRLVDGQWGVLLGVVGDDEHVERCLNARRGVA